MIYINKQAPCVLISSNKWWYVCVCVCVWRGSQLCRCLSAAGREEKLALGSGEVRWVRVLPADLGGLWCY